MARNNRKGKGAGPIPHSMRGKKQLFENKTNNRKRNLSHTTKS